MSTPPSPYSIEIRALSFNRLAKHVYLCKILPLQIRYTYILRGLLLFSTGMSHYSRILKGTKVLFYAEHFLCQ